MEKDMSLKQATTLLTDGDLQKLKEMNIKLTSIPSSESTRIQIELLFFDVLSILRNYQSIHEIQLLSVELRLLYEKQYKEANNKSRTLKNRVGAIRRFKNSVRIILRKIIGNMK